MGPRELIPKLLARRGPPVRPSGFIALLDVIFASIGVFVAIIVIQATLIRAEDRPAEADLYAVLHADGTIGDLIPNTQLWRDLGRVGEQATLPPEAWLQRVGALSDDGQLIVKIEIAHGADALDLRHDLEKSMNRAIAVGVGAGNAPPFTVVWRPLSADTDRLRYLESRAFEDDQR